MIFYNEDKCKGKVAEKVKALQDYRIRRAAMLATVWVGCFPSIFRVFLAPQRINTFYNSDNIVYFNHIYMLLNFTAKKLSETLFFWSSWPDFAFLSGNSKWVYPGTRFLPQKKLRAKCDTWQYLGIKIKCKSRGLIDFFKKNRINPTSRGWKTSILPFLSGDWTQIALRTVQ